MSKAYTPKVGMKVRILDPLCAPIKPGSIVTIDAIDEFPRFSYSILDHGDGWSNSASIGTSEPYIPWFKKIFRGG